MVRIVLLRLLESYFRRPLLNLVPLVVALVVGGIFVAVSKPKYVANGSLFVEKESLLASLTSSQSAGSAWISPAQATTNELTELLATNAFVRSAIQKTDLEAEMSGGPQAIEEAFSTFRKAIDIQVRGEKLVAISAASTNPNLAQQYVLATMDAYVLWKINSDYQESVVAQSFFEQQIEPYGKELEKARQQLVNYLNAHRVPVIGDRPPDETIMIDQLQAAVTRAEERYTTAKNNEESARLALAKSESVTRQTYLVIDQPEIPRMPEVSTKGMVVDVLIFVAVGLVLSVLIISGGALLDHSLRFPIDVRHTLSLPVLAMVPISTQQPGSQPTAMTKSTHPADGQAGQSDSTVLQPQI